MAKIRFFCLLAGIVINSSLSALPIKDTSINDDSRYSVIEDFDDGEIELSSFPDQDINPDAWELNSDITYDNSPFSLRLYGNTWKTQSIQPVAVDAASVWQAAVNVPNTGEIQGLGVSDGENWLFYSFYGSEELDIEEWIPVYQGAFPSGQWQLFQLPLGDDWWAWYEYYPEITTLVYVNDNDSGSGEIYFDLICDITYDLPVPPYLVIGYDSGPVYTVNNSTRVIDVQFFSLVYDPDSAELFYFWQFGDGGTSQEANPAHTYDVTDDHSYSVLLEVEDDTGRRGRAACEIEVDEGETSYPLTVNFVGDVMLARGYEQTGGIIPTLGVEAIFEPILPWLGEAADITVANLECPLTTHPEHHPTKTIYFKGNPANVAGLVYAGIDIVTLANNHILDYNYPGLLETQETLTAAGIRHSGAGINSYEAYLPLFYHQKGLSLAFLASCDRTGQYNNYQPFLQAGFNKPGFAYMTPYYVYQQINEVRETADLVIVEMHAGSEYSSEPGSNYDLLIPDGHYQEEDYHFDMDIPHMWDIEIRHHAVDHGADLVIVHHPHIIQGMEVYNGKLIAHSLGNFAFDLNYAETMPSLILQGSIYADGFREFQITPVFIDDWIPQRATGELGLHILDYLAQKSRDLGTRIAVNREEVTARVIMDTLSAQIFAFPANLETEIFLADGWCYSPPLRLPRAGSIGTIQQIDPGRNWEYRLGREVIWFGNFEQEGCTLWNINSNDEWLDDQDPYAGQYALRHRRQSNSGDNIVTNLEQRTKLPTNTSCTLHGYIRTSNAADVNLQIYYYQYRYSSLPISDENLGAGIFGDNGWAYYYKDLTIPDNAGFFDIRATSDCPVAGEANSWFDNIGLIAWQEWSTFLPEEEYLRPNDFYYLQIRTPQYTEMASVDFTEYELEPGPFVTSDDDTSPAPGFRLAQNFPNPFNPETTITYQVPYPCEVEIGIYNIKGQKVRTLIHSEHERGYYTMIWNGRDDNRKKVSSGVYFYKLSSSDQYIVRKMLLIK